MLAKYFVRSLWLPLLRCQHCKTLTVPGRHGIGLGRYYRHNLLKLQNPSSCLTLQQVWHLRGSRDSCSKQNQDEKETETEDKAEHPSAKASDDGDVLDQPGYKDIHLSVSSLRATTIANKALGLGTAKMKEAFYGGRIRLNKLCVLRKAQQATEGDTIDIILEVTEDGIRVQRVRVLVIGGSSAKGNTRITVRRWKRLNLPSAREGSEKLD